MTWLKTYSPSGVPSGRVNIDQVLWFDTGPSSGTYGVYALVNIGTGTFQRLVSAGYPYATAADAVAAIDDIILNGS